jgi:hypothetical protein
LIAQLESSAGPFTFQAGYETDHKAITQNILPTGAKVKTTDNAAVVVDFAPSDAFGATAEFNVTNFNPTGYSLGLRGAVRDIGWNLVAVGSQDPGNTSIVATYGGVLAFPSYTLFGIGLPTVEFAALDNYTLMAPPRPDGKPTTGPGGVAMGKNAGVTLRLGIENPIIPNLAFEYNLQAKLIENIFLPNENDPITSETLFLSSSLGF